MAKTTRRDEKKPKGPTPIAVLDPPETGETDDNLGTEDVPADPEAETPPKVAEVADNKEISRRRGNAQYKKAPSVGFISRLSQFEKTEWETQLLLYIYRLAPITDRLATGNQVKYIARFTEPIDEETILKDKLWGGSGKYRLTLNRKDPETGKSSCIDQAEIEIEHPQYPPVVPVGEWVDDPRNKRWAWARQPGQTNGQPPATVTTATPAGPTVNDLVDGMIKLKTLEPSTDTSMQTFVMERLASAEDRSNKLIDRIITPPTPPPAPEKPAQDPMVAFMLERLGKAEDRATMLLEKLLSKENAPAKPEADPLSTIAIKLLEKRLEKMDEKPDAETAAERQSRMNGTQELISEITKSMAPVLDKAFSLFTLMAAQKQAPQQTQRPPATRTVEVAAQPVDQTQQAETTTTNPAPPPTTQPTMEQMQQQVLNLVLGQATPTLKQYLRDSDGSSFAEIFCDMAFAIPNVPPPFNEIPGVQAHEFAKQFGRDAIVNAYKLNPSLYQQIAPNAEAEQAFVTFLDEFLAYDPNAEAEDYGS